MDAWKRETHSFAKFFFLRKDFELFAGDDAGFDHFLFSFFQIFLKSGNDDVDSAKATVGTSELRKGSGSFAAKKNKVIVAYVRMRIIILRVQLSSQVLSNSTRRLRSFIFSISWLSWSRVGIS